MATPKLYIETSVVSYLTAQGSRDLVLAAHQEVTRTWWALRDGYALYVSQSFCTRAGAGDSEAAGRRLEALQGMPLLHDCKHIANATLRSRIESICRTAGFEPPVICTPLGLVAE